MKPTFESIKGFTGVLGSAALAEGTNANTFQINTAEAGVMYAINGLAYHKADTDNIAFTTHAVQADLTTCLYLVQVTADGTVSTKKGNEELTADLEAGRVALHFPEPDASNCALGAIKVKNVAGTFTAGSTDLGAATVTDTYYNFALGGPARPLES